MAIVVVGGHTRNVGKTSLIAGLIAALPEARWTAMKITQFGHGKCSVSGSDCGCAVDEHAFALSEERDRSGESDTSRFLAAGAERVFWLRTKQGQLALGMPALRETISGARNVILESNSVLRFLQPDVYLAVLNPAVADFKASAREFLDRATAFVVHATMERPVWQDVPLKLLADKPKFVITPPVYCTPEVVDHVRQHLSGDQGPTMGGAGGG